VTRSVIIVQARLASTRLPNKVLMPLGDKPILAHVLSRCAQVPGVQAVIFAVPQGEKEAPLVDVLKGLGAQIARGPEQDVLARYTLAARSMNADCVLRVTSDCPVIDPIVCGQTLDLVARGAADFACNNMPRGWPHGLDCEAFTMDLLEAANRHAQPGPDREHVGPWMRRHLGIRRANLVGPGGPDLSLRWTLDYAEDLAFFQALEAVAPGDLTDHGTESLVALCTAHPEIVALNSQHHQPV
jgi:glutamate-1-semialdehyde 2,1-aminomutase/spore coat polysaccharide biosynthesis protein SpsF